LHCSGLPHLFERQQREQIAGRTAGIEPLAGGFMEIAEVADDGGFQVAEGG
jgi:hypothetical protein